MSSKSICFNNLFFIIPLILTIGIYADYTSFLICLLFIILRLFTTNKETAGLFLILFGGLLGGSIRTVYPLVPIYGIIVVFTGIVLLRNDIPLFIKENSKSIVFLILVLVVFFIAFLYGPLNVYSTRKIIEIALYGLLLLFAYSVFNSSTKISNIVISQALILTVIAYYVIGIHEIGFSPPTSFFDYEWYRYNTSLYRDQDISGVNYQSIGMNVLYAFTFLLGQNKSKIKGNNIFILLFYITCFQLLLSSGARQAIFGLLAILLIYFLFYKRSKNTVKKISTLLLAFLFIYLGINFVIDLDISFISKSLNPTQGDYLSATGRASIYMSAITIIKEKPLFGVGIGGFAEYCESSYPHNFILEIITETGIIGLLLLSSIIIIYLKTSKISLRHETANGTFFFLILSCLLARALFSSDLTESIGLFSGVLALKNSHISRKYLSSKS